MNPRVTVVMPTFRQARFIQRAIESLRAQSFEAWRLLIIDDGSPDETAAVVAPFLRDPRVKYVPLGVNQGLGRALNVGLDMAETEFIAYLPSDDIYFRDHLATLVAHLDRQPQAVAAFSGVRHHYNRMAETTAPGEPPQLVQCLHHRVDARWLERGELITDDLDRMFWSRLRQQGEIVETRLVTCEWVDHPSQRHKLIREPKGGVNPFRVAYDVREPMRFHSTVGNAIDEVGRYQQFRERPDTPFAADGLKIVLAGELAYNAERVLALEERGNRLFGLWMPDPYWYNTVGPLPFGHVQDLPRSGWEAELPRVGADVIYALLNWQAVPFAHHVMERNPGVPFVWHFKEGPFICLEHGTWPQLVDLTRRADGLIFSSPEMREWFVRTMPEIRGRKMLVLDGDLPKRDWFQAERSPLLSEIDGEIHTVVPGRPIGLHPETVQELASHKIHLHFYGDFTHGQWRQWIERTRDLAGRFFHLHGNVDQESWVTEFSQYDAGWLHLFESENYGDWSRANWDDLNYPARIATLAVAGLPMIQRDNTGSIVATQALADREGLGVTCASMEDLASQLHDRARLTEIHARVWASRASFTFDAHADRLLAFFREVIGANRPIDAASEEITRFAAV
jgi:glycosyltransferase involved in cell wall biosynthesis